MEIQILDSSKARCSYCPISTAKCNYPDRSIYTRQNIPTASTKLDFSGTLLCTPALDILNPERNVQTTKSRFEIDDETNMRIAEAQLASGCNRYSPRSRKAILARRENYGRFLPEEILQKLTPEVKAREGVFGDFVNETISGSDIPEGSVITGLETMSDFDLLINALIFEQANILNIDYKLPPSIAKDIRDFLATKRFNGNLREITPLVVLNNLDEVTAENVTSGTNLMHILLEAGLFSTGKGRVDTYVGAVKIDVSRANKMTVQASLKHLIKKDGLSHLELMLASSRIAYEAAAIEKLKTVVSAGLPGLGKRR